MQPWEGVDMAVCHVAVTCSSAVQHPWRVSQLLQESHAFHLAAQGSLAEHKFWWPMVPRQTTPVRPVQAL